MNPNRVMIIGSGALGKALGLHFFKNHTVQFWGRSNRSFVFEGVSVQVFSSEQHQFYKEIKAADCIVLSTADGALQQTVQKIEPFVQAHQRVLHVSGTQSLQVLQPLTDKGAKIGVFHVLQTFHQESYKEPTIFKSASATFVGNNELFTELFDLAKQQEMQLVQVSDLQKKQIHIAAVFVCNFQHALFDAARKSSDLPENELMLLLRPLIHQTLNYTTNGGILSKLSGPVKRGDERTIQDHLEALRELPEQQKMYQVLTNYLKKAIHYD